MKNILKLSMAISVIFISFSINAQNVGIGNTSPAEKLDVTGNVKADTLMAESIQIPTNAGAEKILVSDADGIGTWQAGPTVVEQLGAAAGSIGVITGPSSIYVFAGPTSTVTLNGSQRIVFFGQAALGTNSGVAIARISPCYQQGSGVISNLLGSAYSNIEIGTTRGATPVVGTSAVFPAGTYTIGIGVRNVGSQDLNSNDWGNYTYFVL